MSKVTRQDTNQITLPFDAETNEAVPVPRFCKDPLNLLEFPVTLLGKKPFYGTLKYSDTITQNSGLEINRCCTVTSSSEWGMPLAWEEQLLVALLEITREQNFAARRVPFSRYDLVQRLNMPRNQQSYNRISLGLDRLVGVTIKAENSFYERATKTYNSLTFHLLDKSQIHEEVRGNIAFGDVRSHNTHIVWGEDLFKSMVEDRYYKDLDVNFFMSLHTATARRLFRYLDKAKYDGPNRQKDVFPHELQRLCHERLGLSRSIQALSALKQQLKDAHQELYTRGFLKCMPEYSVMRKDRKIDPDRIKVVYSFGKPIFIITMPRGKVAAPSVNSLDTIDGEFVVGDLPQELVIPQELLASPKPVELQHRSPDVVLHPRADTDLNDEQQEAMQWLLDNHMTRSKAREFAVFNLEEVFRQREYLSYREKVLDMGAYLRSAITNGFGAPKQYLEKQAASAANDLAEKRRQESRKLDEKYRQSKIGTATKIQDYLDGLQHNDKQAYEVLFTKAWHQVPVGLRKGRAGEALCKSNVNTIVKTILELD